MSGRQLPSPHHLEGRVITRVEKSNRSRLILRRLRTSSSSSNTRAGSIWLPSMFYGERGCGWGCCGPPTQGPPTTRTSPTHLLQIAGQHCLQLLQPLQVARLFAL